LPAFGPVRDSAPENGGDAGDIVTLIEPTVVPDAVPPLKLEFERLTAAIVCPGVTAMPRFAVVLAVHAGIGVKSATNNAGNMMN
jgi:hypothetical protein